MERGVRMRMRMRNRMRARMRIRSRRRIRPPAHAAGGAAGHPNARLRRRMVSETSPNTAHPNSMAK